MENNFKINFIGAGTPRSGTTWLSKCLAEHPEINFSIEKETHFFDRKFKNEDDLKTYQGFFADRDGIKGEFTPSYYIDEEIAKNIKSFFPEAKILIVLRNPVKRTFSNYAYNRSRGKGLAAAHSFEEVIAKGDRTFNDSFYYRYLSKFLRHFDKSQYLIMIYEDSLENPREFIKKIYSFLGVDSSFVPASLENKINISGSGYRYIKVNRFIYSVRRKLKGMVWLRRFLKSLRLNKLANFILKKNFSQDAGPKEKVELSEKNKQHLWSLYMDDVRELEKFLGRDLSVWYKK